MKAAQVTKRKVSERTVVLRVTGALDPAGAQTLAVELAEAFGQNFRHVVLDMDGVDSLSSAGIGVLFTARQRFRADGGDMILCGLSENIMYVLNELDVVDQMNITPTVKKALSMTQT